MVDLTPSSSLGAEETVPQYSSRREMREAQARKNESVAPSTAVIPVVTVAASELTSPALAAPGLAAGLASPALALAAPAPFVPAAPSARKLQRGEVAALRASAPQGEKRKHPLSVLAVMAVVGGMFAVAGLPAYAMTTPELVSATANNKSEALPQTVTISADAATLTPVRDGFRATTPDQLAEMNEDALRAANNEAYLASGAREAGDDYPWPYELYEDQGGGLSPLNYYYRECVDFVAWRLNRDQGYYAAPYKWVWSNLTPFGGNGGQWQYNWEALGRTVSNVPLAGAVAYMGGNHVAYVKSVNADGSVTLEEYNYVPHMYSTRTVPASTVASFLYPPT